MPLRFCYKGNTFINHHSLRGRLKECTQLGAELMGEYTADADAELLSMIVDCLQAAGLKEFQISVGHADIFNGLAEAAGLSDDETDELRAAFQQNFLRRGGVCERAQSAGGAQALLRRAALHVHVGRGVRAVQA